MSDLDELLDEYLRGGKLLQFATSRNDRPWVCHVWYAWDRETHTVVFMSKQSRRHCDELRSNRHAAGAVIAMELDGLGQRVRGVNFEGEATPAASDELERWYGVYASKWPQVRDLSPMEAMDADSDTAWMFTIRLTRAILFDEVNFPSQPRQEIEFNAG